MAWHHWRERVDMWADAAAFPRWGHIPQPGSQHHALVCPAYLTLVLEAQLEALPTLPSFVHPSPHSFTCVFFVELSLQDKHTWIKSPYPHFVKSAKTQHGQVLTTKYQ